MPQREAATADPGDPATEDVEFLTRDGLGRVRQEREIDVRHAAIVAAARGTEAPR
jgi:hypothetical protein